MKVKFEFAPGQKVKDIVSGMEGIINANVVLLEGYKQHQVQPASKDGNDIPDAWTIDDAQLELIEGELNVNKIFEKEFKYNLGSLAKDTVSGIEGILIKAIYFINGCSFYKLQPKVKDGDIKLPNALYINETLVELIKFVEEPILEEKPLKGPSERITHIKHI